MCLLFQPTTPASFTETPLLSFVIFVYVRKLRIGKALYTNAAFAILFQL